MVIQQVESVRVARAVNEVKMDKLDDRLGFIEDMLGMANPEGGTEPRTPQVIVDLQSTFANFKAENMKKCKELEYFCEKNRTIQEEIKANIQLAQGEIQCTNKAVANLENTVGEIYKNNLKTMNDLVSTRRDLEDMIN